MGDFVVGRGEGGGGEVGLLQLLQRAQRRGQCQAQGEEHDVQRLEDADERHVEDPGHKHEDTALDGPAAGGGAV